MAIFLFGLFALLNLKFRKAMKIYAVEQKTQPAYVRVQFEN